MITKLLAESFKSLLNVSIELGQFNVLIGANGSGKSNVLEALGVLGAAASGRVDDTSLLRRGVRPGVPALYKSSFKGTKGRRYIRFTADWTDGDKAAHYNVGLWNPTEEPSPAWRYHTELLEDLTGKVGRSPATKSINLPNDVGYVALAMADLDPERPAATALRCLQQYAIYAPSTLVLRGLVADSVQQEPLGLTGGRLAEAVAEVLRLRGERDDYYHRVCGEALELIDWANMYGAVPPTPQLLSPSVPAGRWAVEFRDRFMADGRNRLTGYDASEGALYVLCAMVLCAHPHAPPALAVDNFDHGLNPRLARALIERMCSWALDRDDPRQVIVTTHNPLVLDGLDLTDDRVRLFAVDRSNRGSTQLSRVVVDDALLRRAEEGWTLSRLWVMGELGGVPNI